MLGQLIFRPRVERAQYFGPTGNLREGLPRFTPYDAAVKRTPSI